MKYKKRKDGRYATTIKIGVDPDTGKNRYRYVYGKTLRELEANVSQIRAALSLGIYADDKHMTLKQYASKWLEATKAHKSYKTYEGYRVTINNHLGNLADVRISKVTRTDCQALISQEESYEQQRRLRMTLHQVFDSAIDDGLIVRNPCARIEIVKNPGTHQRAFTDLEREAILSADYSDPQGKMLCVLLYYSGLRPGEALALDRHAINIKGRQIQVTRALAYGKNQPFFKEPKTSSGRRAVQILSPLMNELIRYLQGVPPGGLLFQSNGGPWSKTVKRRRWEAVRGDVEKRFDQLAEGCPENARPVFDREGFTPYRFRHDFCTRLHDAGIDVKDAQMIMGHADVKLTLNIYTHLDKMQAPDMSAMEPKAKNPAAKILPG